MGKIYEGEVKLNNIQVCEKLKSEMTHNQKVIIGRHAVSRYGLENQHTRNYRSFFAHTVLDAYKYINGTDDHTMMIKKCLKHLMEKYMKSIGQPMTGEDSAYKLLLDECVAIHNKEVEE